MTTTETATMTHEEAVNEPRIYKIRADYFPVLEEKIAKLNKRGLKLGCEPIQLVKVGEEIHTEYAYGTMDGHSTYFVAPGSKVMERSVATGVIRRILLLTVHGTTPKLAGWSFLGTLAHVEGVGTVIRAVPGIEIPTQYREALPICQHCNTRRTRNETFIVRHDDNTTKQVGRQCIADFLGHQNPEGIAAWVELLGGVDEMMSAAEDDDYMEGGYGGGKRLCDILAVLSTASLMIRSFGWTSKANAEILGKSSTCDDVKNYIFGKRDSNWDKVFGALVVEDEDTTLAQKALDWARELDAVKCNDYLYNLSLYAKAEAIEEKGFGLVVSMISAYKREVEKIELAMREAKKPSEHFGTVGERGVFTLTVISVFDYDSDYGTVHIHKMADTDGNVAIWKTASERLEEGREYIMSCGVKAHTEYRNKNLPDSVPMKKQTELTRCKLYVPKVKKAKKAKKVEVA